MNMGARMPGDGVALCLSNTASMLISCEDCGHTTVWFERHFRQRGLRPDHTVGQVSKRLFCPACRRAGGRGKELRIEAFPLVHQMEIA